MTAPSGLDHEQLRARFQQLKRRAASVSADYDRVESRASRLEASHKHLHQMAEHESHLMGVIELLMQDDVRAGTVLDYVIVFFRLLLSKLRKRGHDFDDVKQLHCALQSDVDVEQTIREQRAIRIVLEALQHHKWPDMTSEVVTTSPGGDAQISSALLYLRLQRNFDPVMSSALQRALCTAHERMPSDKGTAMNTEVFSQNDVNLNACDVNEKEKEMAVYYVDDRVKKEDYASFDRGLGNVSNGAEKDHSREAVESRHPINDKPYGNCYVHATKERLDSCSCSDDDNGTNSTNTRVTDGESYENVALGSSETKEIRVEKPGGEVERTPALSTFTSTLSPKIAEDEKDITKELEHSKYVTNTTFYVICYDAIDSAPTETSSAEATNDPSRRKSHVTETTRDHPGEGIILTDTTNDPSGQGFHGMEVAKEHPGKGFNMNEANNDLGKGLHVTDEDNDHLIQRLGKTDVTNDHLDQRFQWTGMVNDHLDQGLHKTGMVNDHLGQGLHKTGMVNDHLGQGLHKTGMVNDHLGQGLHKTGMVNDHLGQGLHRTDVTNDHSHQGFQLTDKANDDLGQGLHKTDKASDHLGQDLHKTDMTNDHLGQGLHKTDMANDHPHQGFQLTDKANDDSGHGLHKTNMANDDLGQSLHKTGMTNDNLGQRLHKTDMTNDDLGQVLHKTDATNDHSHQGFQLTGVANDHPAKGINMLNVVNNNPGQGSHKTDVANDHSDQGFLVPGVTNGHPGKGFNGTNVASDQTGHGFHPDLEN